MEKNEFLKKLAEILDCEEELTMETVLADVEEWDSLGILTFIAEMESAVKVSIKGDDVKKAVTVAELYSLLP